MMTALQNASRSTGAWARRILAVLLATVMAVLLAIMFLQIVLRYGFNDSLIWAEEACRHLLIWASFLACFAAYERGEIASVTMLRDALPRKAGLALAILANIAAIFLLGVLIHYGFAYAQRIGYQPIPALGFIFEDMGLGDRVPSMYWVFASLPVGMSILALRLAVDILIYAGLWVDGGHARDLRNGAVRHLESAA